jgi:hypothetical protein
MAVTLAPYYLPFLETIERLDLSSKTNEVPELFWQAIETASSLVSPLKEVRNRS